MGGIRVPAAKAGAAAAGRPGSPLPLPQALELTTPFASDIAQRPPSSEMAKAVATAATAVAATAAAATATQRKVTTVA